MKRADGQPAPQTSAFATPSTPHSILRERQVLALTNLPRSTRSELRKRGLFPEPISLTRNGAGPGRACGWLAADIQRWIEQRIAESQRV
jgi:predicted DNA-binding transcriptional regulator AlpA